MKNYFKVIMLLTIAFISFSCNNKPLNATRKNTLEEILQRRYMVVSYYQWRPFVFGEPRALTGIFVDMVNLIAQDLNVKVIWKEEHLENITASINPHQQYDFSIGPTFMTIPKTDSILLTQPIAYTGISGLLRKIEYPPKSIKDFNSRGITIAVLKGQPIEEICRVKCPLASIYEVYGKDSTAPLNSVLHGDADVALVNNITIIPWLQEHPNLPLTIRPCFIGEDQIQILPLAWSVGQGDYNLLNFLNNSITYIKTSGKLQEI